MANEHRNEWFEGVQKCTLDETLFDVMERIVRAEVGLITYRTKSSMIFQTNNNAPDNHTNYLISY